MKPPANEAQARRRELWKAAKRKQRANPRGDGTAATPSSDDVPATEPAVPSPGAPAQLGPTSSSSNEPDGALHGLPRAAERPVGPPATHPNPQELHAAVIALRQQLQRVRVQVSSHKRRLHDLKTPTEKIPHVQEKHRLATEKAKDLQDQLRCLEAAKPRAAQMGIAEPAIEPETGEHTKTKGGTLVHTPDLVDMVVQGKEQHENNVAAQHFPAITSSIGVQATELGTPPHAVVTNRATQTAPTDTRSRSSQATYPDDPARNTSRIPLPPRGDTFFRHPEPGKPVAAKAPAPYPSVTDTGVQTSQPEGLDHLSIGGIETPFLPGQSCEYRDAYSAHDGQKISGIHQQLWAAREDSSPADDAYGGSLSEPPQLPENLMKIPEEVVGNAAPQTDPVSPLGSGDGRPAQAVGASSPAKRHKNRSDPQSNKKRYPGGNWPDEALVSGDGRPVQAVGVSSPAKRHKNQSEPQNNKKRYPGGNWPDEVPYFNEVTFADDGGNSLGELILNDDPFQPPTLRATESGVEHFDKIVALLQPYGKWYGGVIIEWPSRPPYAEDIFRRRKDGCLQVRYNPTIECQVFQRPAEWTLGCWKVLCDDEARTLSMLEWAARLSGPVEEGEGCGRTDQQILDSSRCIAPCREPGLCPTQFSVRTGSPLEVFEKPWNVLQKAPEEHRLTGIHDPQVFLGCPATVIGWRREEYRLFGAHYHVRRAPTRWFLVRPADKALFHHDIKSNKTPVLTAEPPANPISDHARLRCRALLTGGCSLKFLHRRYLPPPQPDSP